MTAANRHDYARIWRNLRPAERDRRISTALKLWSEGATLKEVARRWNISRSALCQALIAYAPKTWQQALLARAIVHMEDAQQAVDTAMGVNLISARKRLKLRQWHVERAMAGTVGRSALRRIGREINGPCPKCGDAKGVYVGRKRPARCFTCDWEGERESYLATASRV